MGGREQAPGRSDARGRSIGVPSAKLSLGWLLASRANLRFTRPELDTASPAATQVHPAETPAPEGWKAGKSVLKKGPFLVQRMGSASGRLAMKAQLTPLSKLS